MKNIFILTLLFFIICLSSSGQWYVKKYGVTDINCLTDEQLIKAFEGRK